MTVDRYKKINKEILLVFSLVFVSFGIHFFFRVDGFGEQDSARIANLVLRNCLYGEGNTGFYITRVSPLYIQFLKGVLCAGLHPRHLPAVMNWVSIIIGSLCFVPMYYFFKRMINARVAFWGGIFCFFMPAFWLAGIYGMPLIIAFFCFMVSALFFLRSQLKGKTMCPEIIVALLFACLSLNFKADIVLCFGIYLGVSLFVGSRKKGSYILAFAIPSVAFVSVLLHGLFLVTPGESQGEFANRWVQTFPFTLHAILDRDNLSVLPASMGWFAFVGAILSCLYCLKQTNKQKLLLFIVLTAAPSYLFWGFIIGNSARHIMVADIFLIFLLTFILVERTKTVQGAAIVVGCCIILNYFSALPNASTRMPSSRIFESQKLIQANVQKYHSYGKEFFELPYSRKIAVCSFVLPYIFWEVNILAQRVERVRVQDDTHYRVFSDKGIPQEVKFLHGENRSYGPVKGWYLWTCEENYRLINQ